MKVVLLAGGLGSRISEESHLRPKPMIEIGDMPILWHIMKHYSLYGHNDFIICAGYKQHMVKEFFSDYFLRTTDVTFDYTKGTEAVKVHATGVEPWRITVADTGVSTQTAGRIRRIQDYIGDEPFMLTYGDGVSNVNLDALLDFHKKMKCTVTLTAVDVARRFGVMDMDDSGKVSQFSEKGISDSTAINGGFMIIEPAIFEEPLLDNDDFSKVTLEKLAAKGELAAYRHHGFWHPMDTQRDKVALEELWKSGDAPWMTWKEAEHDL